MNSIRDDLKSLSKALIWYTRLKIKYFANRFEDIKNFVVELLMHRRGAHQKRFWHGSILILLVVAIITSGVFGGQSLVSSTFPGIGGPDPRFATAFEPFPNGILFNPQSIVGLDTHTNVTNKPRSEIISYKVETGDTISTIAQKFSITTDTIKWANDLTSDAIKPGQTLKILPVAGVSYIVKSGDTLQSVAKKYSAEAQAIVDFPFNDIPDDFSLKQGQLLIIPDGSPPQLKLSKPRPKYLAQGPQSAAFSAPGGAQFIWPSGGSITQYYAWYHPGVDIANSSAPGIAASDGGIVVVAGWPDGYGYGNRVVIDHGNGYRSLYAHLSNVYVSVGEKVSRGQLVGQMGSTGRSTGTHLHLEIHYKGVPLNPLAILK